MHHRPSPLASLVLALAATAAHGQPQDAAAPPAAASSAPATTDAARKALGRQEGDVDQTRLLKETLSATEKQYSLLKAGKTAVTYDLTYSYTGQQQISASFEDQTLRQFSIDNIRGHTITNTFSGDYGVRDNFTANLTVPLVSRYSQTETSSGLTNAFGDVSFGARYQPFALTRDWPSTTVTGTLRLPTGRSPFKTIEGQDLATGAGYGSLMLGLNASKVVDPVAIFGSLNTTFAAPAKHLSQQRNGQTLTEVRPGASLGFGIGFAYAMSYNISTTVSFQEQVSARSKLMFLDAGGNPVESKTASQVVGMLNLGLGVRVSPVTTMNFSVGVGLTTDTPDFTVGMNMPLHF